MRVLIADKFEQSGRDGLEAIGCEVSYQPDLKDEALVEAVRCEAPDVLDVRGTKVTEPMLAAGQIKHVVRAGAGYNTINVAAASRRGIYVSHSPGQNSVIVAELAFVLIPALDRPIPDNAAALRRRAYFVNAARAEVVDQPALIEAMKTRGIRAGLDVYAGEPTSATAEFADGIRNEANLYGTHHIGASTDQAQEAIAAETVRIVREVKETGKVPNVVNLAQQTPATHRLVVRHLDRPGRLATVLDAIKSENINVHEMKNIG